MATNIVLHESGCSRGTFFCTLEFCDGGSADKLMKSRGGKLPLGEAAAIVLQALQGLAYARSVLSSPFTMLARIGRAGLQVLWKVAIMTPTADVEVSGTRRTAALTAIIDTGFDGDLCVPLDVAVTLGLELIGSAEIELADGSHKRELPFTGSVKFVDETREVELALTESDQALVGTGLLAGCQLAIDFEKEKVRLWRRPIAAGKGKRR